MTILFRNARVLTLAGPPQRRGAALADLGVIAAADVLIDSGRIARVAPAGEIRPRPGTHDMNAAGRVLMPGFIDCHTHACWAGSRIAEWEQKLAGAAYLDILKAGGGIMSTVRAVRAATQAGLQASLAARLTEFLENGTTTLEVKSGYGLTTADELKMLRAIAAAARTWPGTVSPTALLGHALDESEAGFVDRVIHETLPAVHAEFPGIVIDAFCEQGAWPLADAVRLLETAVGEEANPIHSSAGAAHNRAGIRVHADQFNPLGMIREAVRLRAISVDHLEASIPADLALLAASETFGVGLPICGLHLDGRFANLRSLVDAGGLVAIATNCNPGSAPCTSMPLAIAAAVRHCGLTAQEAIAAATINPAAVLGYTDRARIEAGARADVILLRHTDERALAYELGGNPVDTVVCGGNIMHRAGAAST